MATNTGAFFAGIGTTFVVLTIGFGGGLMMAKSALKEPGEYQTRAASEALTPVRVILPTSAEAAQPPQQEWQAASPPEPTSQPAVRPAKQLQNLLEKQDTKKLEADELERKRRYAARKAKRQAEARAREQREQQNPRKREDTPILAFSGDSSPRFGSGFFGN
jgi:type IV secretory pathway VirB10-like protein